MRPGAVRVLCEVCAALSTGVQTEGSAATAGAAAGELVVCTGVHKHYDLGHTEVKALRGVDLTIDQTGFFAIMGPSGSGKSTLLHLLAALDTPDQGQVRVGGTDLSRMTDAELTNFRRKSIGIVFQQFNLIPTLTAIENVQLPGTLAGESKDACYSAGLYSDRILAVSSNYWKGGSACPNQGCG